MKGNCASQILLFFGLSSSSISCSAVVSCLSVSITRLLFYPKMMSCVMVHDLALNKSIVKVCFENI